jgi:hypothetical protein
MSRAPPQKREIFGGDRLADAARHPRPRVPGVLMGLSRTPRSYIAAMAGVNRCVGEKTKKKQLIMSIIRRDMGIIGIFGRDTVIFVRFRFFFCVFGVLGCFERPFKDTKELYSGYGGCQ